MHVNVVSRVCGVYVCTYMVYVHTCGACVCVCDVSVRVCGTKNRSEEQNLVGQGPSDPLPRVCEEPGRGGGDEGPKGGGQRRERPHPPPEDRIRARVTGGPTPEKDVLEEEGRGDLLSLLAPFRPLPSTERVK